MTKKTNFEPAAVGRPPKPEQIRADLDDLSSVFAESELDIHIVRLLALHPNLKVKFRNQDLASLDDATKQTLLSDINDVLGIKSLKKRKP